MSEPKYQMTYMKGDINITVRLDDKTDVVQDVADLVKEARSLKLLEAKPVTATPYQKAAVDSPEVVDAMADVPCKKCGAKQILSKKGNWVCSDFCWTK